jgi:glycosyltransferase involved in cell wall biosynthesis
MVGITGSDRRSGRRILMVCPHFLPHIGGVESHVKELCLRLRDLDWDVEVVTIDATHAMAEEVIIEGIPVRRVKSLSRTGEALLAPRLLGELTRKRWDLIHVQHFHAGVAPLALWAAWRNRLPTVVTFHGGGQRHWMRLRMWPPQLALVAPLVLDASRFLLRRTGAMIAVAQFEIDDLARRIGVSQQRFTLIPNGFDPPAQANGARTFNPMAPRLVSMGRLVPEKGHDRVLEAFPHILAARPGATLWIAGAGPMEEELRQRAALLGVADHVEISAISASRRDDLFARLASMDLMVAMSEFEAHPLSVIEALSLGLKVVVSDDRAGLRELAMHGYARLAASGLATAELAAVIGTALDAPRNGPPATFPTWDDCARSVDAVYDRVLRQVA